MGRPPALLPVGWRTLHRASVPMRGRRHAAANHFQHVSASTAQSLLPAKGRRGTRVAADRRSSSGLHDALAECSRSDIMGGCCATYCCATPFGTSVLSPRQESCGE